MPPPKVLALAIAAAGLVAFGVYLAVDTRSQEAASSSSSDERVVSHSASAHAIAPSSDAAAPPRSKKKQLATPEPATIDPAVARELADADPRVRLARVSALAIEGDDPAALLVAARDTDEAVATLAIEALGRHYKEGRVTLEQLGERYADRTLSAKARRAALDAIASVATEHSARFLIELARRGDVEERRAVAILLGGQSRALAQPVLETLSRDSDEIVRTNAAATLKSPPR